MSQRKLSQRELEKINEVLYTSAKKEGETADIKFFDARRKFEKPEEYCQVLLKDRDECDEKQINIAINSQVMTDIGYALELYFKSDIVYADLRNIKSIQEIILSNNTSEEVINREIGRYKKSPEKLLEALKKDANDPRYDNIIITQSQNKFGNKTIKSHDAELLYNVQHPFLKTLMNHIFFIQEADGNKDAIYNCIIDDILTRDNWITEGGLADVNIAGNLPKQLKDHVQDAFVAFRYPSELPSDFDGPTHEQLINSINICHAASSINKYLLDNKNPQSFYSGNVITVGDLAAIINYLGNQNQFDLNRNFSTEEKKELACYIFYLDKIYKTEGKSDYEKNNNLSEFVYFCSFLKYSSNKAGARIYFDKKVYRRIEKYLKVLKQKHITNIVPARDIEYFKKNMAENKLRYEKVIRYKPNNEEENNKSQNEEMPEIKYYEENERFNMLIEFVNQTGRLPSTRKNSSELEKTLGQFLNAIRSRYQLKDGYSMGILLSTRDLIRLATSEYECLRNIYEEIEEKYNQNNMNIRDYEIAFKKIEEIIKNRDEIEFDDYKDESEINQTGSNITYTVKSKKVDQEEVQETSIVEPQASSIGGKDYTEEQARDEKKYSFETYADIDKKIEKSIEQEIVMYIPKIKAVIEKYPESTMLIDTLEKCLETLENNELTIEQKRDALVIAENARLDLLLDENNDYDNKGIKK